MELIFSYLLSGFYWLVYGVKVVLIDRVDVSHYRLSLHLVTAFIILSIIFWKFLEITESKIQAQIHQLIQIS